MKKAAVIAFMSAAILTYPSPSLAQKPSVSQPLDQIETLPISMQVQIGITTEIKCKTSSSISFLPVYGPTTQLKCGDWVTILGAHSGSYFVRTENGSTGYVPATALPTDPCAQTNIRIARFNRQWMPNFKSMSDDEATKTINEIYLKTEPDDISAAYSCLSRSMQKETDFGGYNEYLRHFSVDQQPQTYSFDEKMRLMDFTDALHNEVAALNFIRNVAEAHFADADRRYGDLLDQYNSVVNKYADLVGFVDHKMHDLNSVLPAATQTPTWRRIVAGTLQGIASYTPPKHIVCDTNGRVAMYGDALQPGYIYLNGNLTSHTECREQ